MINNGSVVNSGKFSLKKSRMFNSNSNNNNNMNSNGNNNNYHAFSVNNGANTFHENNYNFIESRNNNFLSTNSFHHYQSPR